MEAAKPFFRQAVAVVGSVPNQVTTDGQTSYPRALRETMGETVHHRTNQYLNNGLEQDHRGIKQRDYPIHGFKNFASASRFCRTFDELRHSFRLRARRAEILSPAEHRQLFRQRLAPLQTLMTAAS
jgi:transposase-like protein